MIRRAMLKNKGSIFIYFIPFCCLIFCGDFWDRLTAVLKVAAFCHARVFFVRFFFRFGFYVALDGKKKKSVTFRNNMIHMTVLKNKDSIFIYFIHFFCLIFCGDFWDRLIAVLKATTLCWICSLFMRIFVIFLFSQDTSLLWKTKSVIFIFHHESIPSTLFFLFFPKPNQFFFLIFCGRFLGQFVMLL
ncbi:hypothetical protein JHK82_055973 [Glycine max]|nr:hypothetical protein JHK86_055795 [Glycine max]KAG4909950.1 hypothetical protein JHK87_056066 [Glycine soja]KAG5077278.1 hypothetical protein JHK82_055973 [Glycine max]